MKSATKRVTINVIYDFPKQSWHKQNCLFSCSVQVSESIFMSVLTGVQSNWASETSYLFLANYSIRSCRGSYSLILVIGHKCQPCLLRFSKRAWHGLWSRCRFTSQVQTHTNLLAVRLIYSPPSVFCSCQHCAVSELIELLCWLACSGDGAVLHENKLLSNYSCNLKTGSFCCHVEWRETH